jgi:hypothetical protein
MFDVFKRKVQPELQPAPAEIQVSGEIRDFFVFRDVLFVRGHVERYGGAEPAISVRLWDETIHPVSRSEDDFFPSTPERYSFCFSLPLPAHTSTESLEKMSVVFDYPSGRAERRGVTADAIARDPYLTSEAGFWAHVQANPNANVLEIGSRARSGITRRNLFPATCNYTGFDIVAGENVNCVGDAHKLSQLLPSNHFDIVFSVSVWEHISMPWLVSLELNKVMKTGGLAMICTHPAWPSHEEPWDFFRFSNYCWDALFNSETGFEIVTRGTGVPCVMGPSQIIPFVQASRMEWHYGYLCTRCVAKKISDSKLSWPVDPGIVSKSSYPQ